MKYFFLALLITGALVLSLATQTNKKSTIVAKECSMGEIKLCYNGVQNKCCPPKFVAQDYFDREY